MKHIIALLLAAVLTFGLAACAAEPAPITHPTQTTPPTETLEPVEQVTVENPLKSLYLSINENETDYFYLNAMEDGTGGAQVEMKGTVRKVATMDASVLHGITKALEEGNFYASQAPEIHALWLEDGRICARRMVYGGAALRVTAAAAPAVPHPLRSLSHTLSDVWWKRS